MPAKRILIVFPTAWDRKQLAACTASWTERYELILAEPSDEACPWDFDVPAFIERTVAEHGGRIHGVMSSSDYPGATVAGAVAMRLGLPGSRPETVIRCSHKYYSRLAQREAVPEATPAFELVRPSDPVLHTLPYPCFLKPVKGAFSIMSGRVNSPEELGAFLSRPAVGEFLTHYVWIFNRLVRALTTLEVDGSWFLAEGLLHGRQATLEGFATPERVEILGIVDSITHPETGSFVRFDYPSCLPEEVQHRMSEIAVRAIRHLGLIHSLFNVEMIWDAGRDQIAIVEINPRICGQFADLYQKVNGTSAYEVAFALAAGEQPEVRRDAGRFAAASSFPLRVFRPVRVDRVPDAGAVRAVEQAFPETLIWLECAAGQVLRDFESNEDGRSCRYGIVNVGGASREDVQARFRAVRDRLGFELTPM